MEEMAKKTRVNQKLALLGFIVTGLFSVNILTSNNLTGNVLPEHLSIHQTKKSAFLRNSEQLKRYNIVKSGVLRLNNDTVETVESAKTDNPTIVEKSRVLFSQEQYKIDVAASGETSKSSKYSTPASDVLATIEMDKRAVEILDNFKHSKKEQATAVMHDGNLVAPLSCTNKSCSFELKPSTVRFVVHTHVKSTHRRLDLAKWITMKREKPSAGDNAFLVLGGAPNYILSPKGAIRVLEYKNGKYHVRTLRGAEISTHWSAVDAKPSKGEIREALKGRFNRF